MTKKSSPVKGKKPKKEKIVLTGEKTSGINYLESLSPEEQLEQLLAASARGDNVESVCHYAQLVFDVIPSAVHKKWITEVLGNRRVVIVAPPESAKTTIISVILLSWWIGKKPWTTNLICSAGENLSNNIARRVADVIEFNEKFKIVFPNVVPAKELGWSRDGYEVKDTSMDNWALLTATKKDPTLASGGVGSSSVNGRRVTGIAIGDDLHDRESKSSETVCVQTVDFVKDTFLPRCMEDAHAVIVQTRWNGKDIVGYLDSVEYEGEKMYQVFVHPAIENDESYWPEQWPIERLERRRAEVGEVDFQLVYLANANATKGNVLKAEYLTDFPQIWIKQEFNRFYGVDFAITQQSMVGTRYRKGDNFAIAKIVDTRPVLVVEDGFVGRVNQAEAENVLFSMASYDNPQRIYLETNAGGEVFYQALMRRMRENGLRLPLIGRKAIKGKAERINQMLPDFQFGRVKVSDAQTTFLKTFRDEWLRFGDKAAHDDTLDAVYWAWRASDHLLTQKSNNDYDAQKPTGQTVGRQIEIAYGL